MFADFISGGIAGLTSRTFTAPLELYRMQRQNAFMPGSTIREVVSKEGIRYLWKGNGTNCIRIIPQNAINYSMYKYCNNILMSYIHDISLRNFISGILAGGVAIYLTYPLETIRSRLSLQHKNSHYNGIMNAIRSTSIRDLYRGSMMSVIGFAPFTGLSFSSYGIYKTCMTKYGNYNSDVIHIVSGGLSGVTALCITYPTDLIRRRLQLQNFDINVPKYSGIRDCTCKILKHEGIRGLYRGLFAGLLKSFPTVAIQFYTLERVSMLLKN